MAKLIKSPFLRASKAKHSGGKARDLGDAARARQDWTGAASQYRRHLLRQPEDFAIWVQLGHALKEAGQLNLAIQAYEEALGLAPHDADLLLNLGHAHKLAGNAGLAASLYQRSVAGDDNLHARRELALLGGHLTDRRSPMLEREFEELAEALAGRCAGLRAINASAVKVLSDGGIALFHDDPWIEFEAEAPEALGTLALLSIEAAPSDDRGTLSGQVYVDQGQGFEERLSASFTMPDGQARIIVVHPAGVRRLRWDPDRGDNRIGAPSLSLRPIGDAVELTGILTEAGSSEPQLACLLHTLIQGSPLDRIDVGRFVSLIHLGEGAARDVSLSHNYEMWRLKNAAVSREDYRRIVAMTAALAYKPTFSFVMPTYNTPVSLLTECLDAMLSQTYPHFEVCIADDHSPDPAVVRILKEYAERDPRVKFVERPANGHISAASNSALALATGDFVVLMDHDDTIPPYALFVVAWYLNQHPEADILYSDEDKITLAGQHVDPYFKGDFNRFLLFGHNMISHLGVYRRALVEQVGGFRLGLEGSQDYDLFLRCYERSSDERIVHIPHILYHWRQVPGSTAISADQKSYALLAAQQAINGHFERTGMPLRSIFGPLAGNTAIRPARSFDTRTSIIIPTRNGLDLLEPCIESILARPQENVEILIVDNGSDDPETLRYLDEMASGGIVRVLRYPEAFNYSLINNFAAVQATGDILCFLNNDTEVVSPDWIDRARAFLSMDDIGAVGARLFYPDGVLQHFGIGIGMSEHGVAGLPHAGYPPGHPGYFSKANLIQEVSAVTAACLFMRAATFAEVGGFEPELRVAYNDVDVCLKVRALGLKILVDPDISLIHKESRSRGSDRDGENARRLDREAAWMHARWGETLRRDPYLSPNIDLMRGDFAFDFSPRVPFPWQQSS